MGTRIVFGFSAEGREGVMVSEDPLTVRKAFGEAQDGWALVTRARYELPVWIQVAQVLYFEEVNGR